MTGRLPVVQQVYINGLRRLAPHGAGSEYVGQLANIAYAVLICLMKLAQPVLAPEFIDPAAAINDFLLARVKRVARRTHLDQEVLAEGGAGCEFVAATTSYFDIAVVGMNVGFHGRTPV